MTLNSTDSGDTVQTGAACLWFIIFAIWQEKEWDPRQQWCMLLYRGTYSQLGDLKVTVHPKIIQHSPRLKSWMDFSLLGNTNKVYLMNILFGRFNTMVAYYCTNSMTMGQDIVYHCSTVHSLDYFVQNIYCTLLGRLDCFFERHDKPSAPRPLLYIAHKSYSRMLASGFHRDLQI